MVDFKESPKSVQDFRTPISCLNYFDAPVAADSRHQFKPSYRSNRQLLIKTSYAYLMILANERKFSI